jgi:hypothetical protein
VSLLIAGLALVFDLPLSSQEPSSSSVAGGESSAQDLSRWQRSPSRWETSGAGGWTIERYEKEQAERPPQPEGLVLLGSASSWMWDNQKWFPEWPSFNRGFGGSMISDSTYFADRITIPHRPAVIVMYAGENDVVAGKPVALTAQHFREFCEKVWSALPKTRIVYVSIRPSERRAEFSERFTQVNALIRAITETDRRLYYVDVASLMVDAEGKTIRAFYGEDNWHPSEKGYELWTALTKPVVKEAFAAHAAEN